MSLALALLGCTAEPPVPSAASGLESASPSPGASSTLGPATEDTDAFLSEVLAYAPLDTQTIRFTDWSRISREGGIAAAGRRQDRRAALSEALGSRHTAPSAFALNKLPIHAELWGWDSTDLLWEAALEGGPLAPSVRRAYVLRLPDTLDLAAIEARFAERGF